MKRMLPALLIATLFIVGCGGEQNQKKKASEIKKEIEKATAEALKKEDKEKEPEDYFSHEDGKFRINFPGTPKETNDIVPTEVGDIEITMFIYEKSVTKAYMVSYNDYPSAIIEESEPKEMLEGGLEGFTSNSGLNSIDERKEIEIQGHPAIYFKAHGTANKMYAVCKAAIVDNRLYQIAIIRDGTYPSQENIDEFFETFELTAKDEAKAETTEENEAETI